MASRKKEKIIELRQIGFTINQIVNELKCAKSTVSYHINKIGLGGTRDKFLIGITDNTLESIKELRLKQKTYLEISKIVNITEDQLKRVCRNFDLNKSAHNISKLFDKVEVLNYYLTVKSLRNTANFFKTTRETIRKVIGVENIVKSHGSTVTKTQSVTNWRKRKKIELVNYKGGKCVCCGYDKSVCALNFHHLDPKNKDFNISGKSYSAERLKKEVDKCILVCSNCHLEIHEEIKEFGFSKKVKDISNFGE